MVRRLVPPDVHLQLASTFEDGLQVLTRSPPDMAIVNLTPADHSWDRFVAACRAQSPCIPVLFESCVHADPREAGLGELTACESFLSKPYTVSELRTQIAWLLRAAESAREAKRVAAGL